MSTSFAIVQANIPMKLEEKLNVTFCRFKNKVYLSPTNGITFSGEEILQKVYFPFLPLYVLKVHSSLFKPFCEAHS